MGTGEDGFSEKRTTESAKNCGKENLTLSKKK